MPLVTSRAAARPPALDVLPHDADPADLLAALRDGQAAARRAAARDLARCPETAAALAACLAAESASEVREAIITSLIEIGNEPAIHGLAALFTSEDTALRNAAVDALCQLGDMAASEMHDRLSSLDPDERIFAVNVLECLRHGEAIIWLRGVLTHDPDLRVGLAAVEAVARRGGSEDVAALRAFAARFPGEPSVTFAVRFACERVTGRALP